MTIEPVLTLGAYLKEQEGAQQRRPVAARQPVPTYKELGMLTKVDPMTVYRLTTPAYRSQLPLNLVYRLIRAMRARGFAMGVHDLVSWELPEGLHHLPADWGTDWDVGVPEQVVVVLGPCLALCRDVGEPPVPTTEALATAAQMSRRQLERILGGTIQRLDLAKLGLLLGTLAEAGWGLRPEDVLYYPDDHTPTS